MILLYLVVLDEVTVNIRCICNILAAFSGLFMVWLFTG